MTATMTAAMTDAAIAAAAIAMVGMGHLLPMHSYAPPLAGWHQLQLAATHVDSVWNVGQSAQHTTVSNREFNTIHSAIHPFIHPPTTVKKERTYWDMFHWNACN
jgi:hypothetical protein